MKGKRTKLLITSIVLGSIMLVSNSAFAALLYSFSFSGGDATFSTDVTTATVDFGVSNITGSAPDDPFFTTDMTMQLEEFTYDTSGDSPYMNSDGTFDFFPTFYDDALLFKDGATELFTMDVSVFTNETDGSSTATINKTNIWNLSGFKPIGYTGGSITIDTLAAYGGVLTLTFQASLAPDFGVLLEDLLSSTTPASFTESYSGKVATAPIPGAVWLLGSGLFGMALIRRRKQ